MEWDFKNETFKREHDALYLELIELLEKQPRSCGAVLSVLAKAMVASILPYKVSKEDFLKQMDQDYDFYSSKKK